jgi:tRNA(Ile)-lysidine synthase
MLLLHLLVEASRREGFSLAALHVHHGLSPNADAWSAHCEAACAALEVPLQVHRLRVVRDAGQSLEEQARRARHGAFSAAGEHVIALAQHADDQAETVLLQLLRGAGPKGLAAMPVLGKPYGGAAGPRPWRPPLAVTRARIHELATAGAIVWVEDESNRDVRLRRNALRHAVLPLLEPHFPDVAVTLGRAARLQAQVASLLDEVADEDLRGIARGEALDCGALTGLSAARQANAVRRWIASRGCRGASEARLQALLRAVGDSGNDTRLEWVHGDLRVFRRKALLFAERTPEGGLAGPA